MLDSARYEERVETGIHGEAGGRPLDETSGRVARWILHVASASDSGVTLEASLDSLSIWRRSGAAIRSPDTDGIIGGRYRGTLSANGRYVPATHPFIPDEIAEFADLRNAAGALLPRLPSEPLAAGAVWRDDSTGATIERLGDSTAAGVRLARYRLERHATVSRAPLAGGADTLALRVRQTTDESGELAWDDARGVVGWTRTVTVLTEIPPGGSVRVPVRSRVVQRVTLTRLDESSR